MDLSQLNKIRPPKNMVAIYLGDERKTQKMSHTDLFFACIAFQTFSGVTGFS
jgi:hypothetical protein